MKELIIRDDVINHCDGVFMHPVHPQSYVHFRPALKQSQYLLEHLDFRQLHLIGLASSSLFFYTLRHFTHRQLFEQCQPFLKQGQYYFMHLVRMQLQLLTEFFSNFLSISPIYSFTQISSLCTLLWTGFSVTDTGGCLSSSFGTSSKLPTFSSLDTKILNSGG